MDDAAITQAFPAIRNTPYSRLAGPTAQTARPPAPSRQPDTVELSPEAQRMSRAAQATEPDVRHELVERVRTQIADGSYDTEEKLDRALEAMIDRLDREEERAEQE